MRRALITGITGQDGSYLAEFLISKGYEVHGIKRRASLFNTQRVDHLYEDPHVDHRHFVLHYGDLTDSSSLMRILADVKPDEIYNLGAQSHVAVSFEVPEYTADVNALGALRLLEAIRFLGLEKSTRYYQASTSEMFGLTASTPQSESTPFHPRSPYAVSKLFAYWTTINYREAYGMYGRALAKKIEVAPWEILRQAVMALPADERTQLIATLDKIADYVERTVKKES